MQGDKSSDPERKVGDVIFHPLRAEEYNLPKNHAKLPPQFGTRPKFIDLYCGACGKAASARVICDLIRNCDKATVFWCVCSCDKQEPTTVVKAGDEVISQIPAARHFHAGPQWPHDLSTLYDEAAKAYAAEAYTAVAMVCRKILMACACHEASEAVQSTQAKPAIGDGKSFAEYVDFIISDVLPYPRARNAIDSIRKIGNEANHSIQFVNQADAKRAMDVVTYLLNSVYSVPIP